MGAAALSTLLGVGAELGSGADGGSNLDIIQALRLSAANSLNQTGQQVVRRNLNIQPTLTVRAGFSSEGDRQSRSYAGAISRMIKMLKLKLALIEDKPVSVHRDLTSYAGVLSRQIGQPIGDPIKLIAPMLARFMATDRAFSKSRKSCQEISE